MATRIIIGWLTFIALFLAAPLNAEELNRTITVTGTGIVNTAPDQATITVGIETQDRTARDALTQNNLRMSDMISVLTEAGITGRDVQTTQLNLNPVWDHRNSGQQPRIVGYAASNLVMIRVRDLPVLGRVLDQISDAGANRIHSIRFGLQDTTDITNEARRRAVADAKNKAELYAGGLGANVGRVITISENSATPRPQPMAVARAESMAMDVPIAEGEVGISARVNVMFELVD